VPSPIEVSVVIPTRNGLGRLAEALAGVVAQRVPLEAIVVDTGSTDGTWAWLIEAARTRSWLRPVRLEGAGRAEALNRAAADARAPFLAFLEPEAAWRPGKLKAQLAAHAADPSVVLSFTDEAMVDAEGRERGSRLEHHPAFLRRLGPTPGMRRLGPDTVATLLEADPIGLSTVLARRDALLAVGGFDAGSGAASTWDLWLRLARAGAIACDPVPLSERLSGSCPPVSDGERAEVVRRHAAALAGPSRSRHLASPLRAMRVAAGELRAWIAGQRGSLRLA
jgi:glycosyltransferase involved in cell wall biosynthesis